MKHVKWNEATKAKKEAMEKSNQVSDAFIEALRAKHGEIWTTETMQRDFIVEGFSSGYCVVRRRSDNVVGSLSFIHQPRFYYSFVENK